MRRVLRSHDMPLNEKSFGCRRHCGTLALRSYWARASSLGCAGGRNPRQLASLKVGCSFVPGSEWGKQMAYRVVTLLLFGLTGLMIASASNPRGAAAGGLGATDNVAAGLAGEPPKRDCQQYNGLYGYYGPNWCMPGEYSYLRDPTTQSHLCSSGGSVPRRYSFFGGSEISRSRFGKTLLSNCWIPITFIFCILFLHSIL